MKVVAVNCPHCGARLRVESTVIYVRCEYCGTTARLQARTRMLERVEMPPGTVIPGLTDRPPQRPMPQMPQMPPRQMQPPQQPAPTANRGGLLVALFTMVGIGGAASAVFYTSMRVRDQAASTTPSASGTSGAAKSAAPDRKWIDEHAALFADLDGDGTQDVIGRTGTKTWNDEVRITALDGGTGKVRWHSDVIADRSSYRAGRLVLDGDLVLLVENHTMRAFRAADGAAKWRIKLDERITKLCAGSPEVVLAVGADEAVRSVRRSDGVVVANAPGKRPCGELPTDERRNLSSWFDGQKHGLVSANRHPSPDRSIVVVGGGRATGTSIAMLAVLEAKGALRWKVPVSPDPLDSNDRSPNNVVVGEREVCCSYSQGLSSHKSHVACFALKDGQRIWDQEHEHSVYWQRILGRTIVALMYDRLVSLDLDTGAVRWKY